MKKLFALALALVMVLGAMSAMADGYKVAFSQIGQESDWRTANTDSIKAAIEGHEGWELIYDDAQQKQENQIKALRNFITQGVDVILFTDPAPPDRPSSGLHRPDRLRRCFRRRLR